MMRGVNPVIDLLIVTLLITVNLEKKPALYSNCTEYKNGDDSSLVPFEWSPVKIIKRCINFAIDTGLKPLCDEEKKLREAYRLYERQRNDECLYEIEELLYLN